MYLCIYSYPDLHPLLPLFRKGSEIMTLREIERKRYYLECLIRSLESKLDRIEPFSNDFEETMNSLYAAIEEIQQLGLERTKFTLQSRIEI
jgi:hypothetical protein